MLRLCCGVCRLCFNTQPPEGGWHSVFIRQLQFNSFNTQPPEGGWLNDAVVKLTTNNSFNTQPPEGGWVLEAVNNLV